MPTAPPRLCPRCRQPAPASQPCPRCLPQQRADADTNRGTSSRRGYNRRWRQRTRKPFLAANPICVLCGRLAQVPDHWPTPRRDLVAQGVADPDAWEFLRPLCVPCHNRQPS